MIPIRRRLYQSLAGFTPRQLFSALQGAWLEPTPGYIWQENTGVTPTTTGGQTIGKIADQSGYGNNATQATAGNRPTYQLDSNGLPLARHDATDSLVVSLPAFNVRRNFSAPSYGSFGASAIHSVIAKFSETVNYGLCTLCSDPTILLSNSGSSGLRFGPATTTTNARIPAFTGNATVSMYIRLVSGSLPASNTLMLLLRGSISGSAIFGLNSVVTSDWKRISLTGAFAVSDGTVGWYLEAQSTGTFAVEITGYQLELGSVATDYQKITNWTSEAFASSGSVYFATPQGMSALHNQSMGTTYTLPALSTDIYSWVVVPQRLNTALEGRLERYMLRKAGLAAPNYLTDDFGETITDDIGDPILAG